MADMIEHSNFVSFKMKQEWEEDIAKEDEEKTKMGLTSTMYELPQSNSKMRMYRAYI